MDLREARFLKKISQWELAVRVGTSQAMICLYENGYRNPNDEMKKKITNVLSCKIEEISFNKNNDQDEVN